MYRRKRSQQERKSKTEKKEQKRTVCSVCGPGRYSCYKKDQIPRIFYGVRYSAFLMTAVR